MSETKFTRGPWALDTVPTSGGSGSCHRIGPFPWASFYRDNTYACLYADGIRIGIDDKLPAAVELKANALLMAAAPDMYEALGLLLSFHESVGSPSPAGPCEMARTALARARGEA